MATAQLMLDTNVKVSNTLANTATITNITNASEALVSCTNTFTDNDIVIVEGVVGLPKINNVVARVKNRTAANVVLESIDTTNFGTYVSGGTLKKVAEWLPFTNSTNFSLPEPQPNRIQLLTIHDSQASEVFGVDSPSQASMSVYAAPFDAAMKAVRKASKAKETRVLEVTLQNGNKLYMSAKMAGGRGLTGEAGQPATGSIEFALQAEETWYQS